MGEEGDGRDRGGRGEASREGEPDAAGLRLLLLRLDSALGVERRHNRGIERERGRDRSGKVTGSSFSFRFWQQKNTLSLSVFFLFFSPRASTCSPPRTRDGRRSQQHERN